jgi:glucokinase
VSAVPALEIGGTHVAGALVDVQSAAVIAETRIRVGLDADGTAASIIATVLECAHGLVVDPGANWGVAIPGPFDYAAGIGRFEGVAKFGSLYGVDVGRALRAGLPPGSEVTFLNDAVAFLIGEWAGGAGAGHDRLAGITLGTGIGSAFLADGRIVDAGPDVPPGGEVHRLTIDRRPLEETVSRRAILAAYERSTGDGETNPKPDVVEIADLARRGDTRARAAIEGPLRALGRALAPWLERFGASALVVGGSMAGSWDLVEPALREGLPRSIELVRARMPDDAGLLGAGIYATRSMQRMTTRHTAAHGR